MPRKLIFPAILVFAVAACDNLGLNAEPQELTVDLDAVGTQDVRLVTSTNWIYKQDPACNPDEGQCPEVLQVLDADTATMSTPLHRTFRFTRAYKYFVEAYPAGGATATLRMTIRIDGKQWFDEARELRPTGANGVQETLQFVYQWRQPTIQ